MNGRSYQQLLWDWAWGTGPVLSLEVADDGRILRANSHTSGLLGRPLEGVSFRDVLVDFQGVLDPARLAGSASGPRPLSVSRKEGGPRTYLCSFFPLSETTWVIGVPDVSEEEALGAQVLALNSDLNTLTRKLQKANAELERLNQLKNQFLGMATHDLRKPLGLIMGFAELIQEEAEDRLLEDERGYLEKILARAEAMKRLVDDFLNLSVIESGRLAIEPEWVTLTDIVANALASTANQAREKGIQLLTAESAEIGTLPLDTARMEQVVENLLSNAIEFSYPGSQVEIESGIDENGVFLEVRDEGVGMEPAEIENLFQPFGRAGSRKTGGEKGTGLGLYISRRIVEAHGGRIIARSAPARGSRFRVILPNRPE